MSTNPPALPDALPDVLIEAYSTAPDLFMSDLLRYVLGAGIVYLIIHVWLAQTLAPRRIQARLPRPGQVRREIMASLRSVTVFAIIGPLVVLEMLTGVSQAYADPMARGPVWFLVSLIILIIAHDTWFYWTHRLMHQPRWFRRLHRLHHQSKPRRPGQPMPSMSAKPPCTRSSCRSSCWSCPYHSLCFSCGVSTRSPGMRSAIAGSRSSPRARMVARSSTGSRP